MAHNLKKQPKRPRAYILVGSRKGKACYSRDSGSDPKPEIEVPYTRCLQMGVTLWLPS